MADYYWVGGTGNWSDYANHWATSSGGNVFWSQIPTCNDNVYFDNNSASGTYTVTINLAAANVFNFDASGITNAAKKLTITSTTSYYLSVYGSWTTPSSAYFASSIYGVGLLPAGNVTLTTNGSRPASTYLTIGTMISGQTYSNQGVVDLVGDLSASSMYFYLYQGSFNTNNYTINVFGFYPNGSFIKNVNLGSSTIYTSGAAFGGSALSADYLNAGTSNIYITSNNLPSLSLGTDNLIFYNVYYTTNNLASEQAQISFNPNVYTVTFNILNLAAQQNVGSRTFSLGGNVVVNSNLTIQTSGVATRRYKIKSSTPTIQRTITVNGTIAPLADIDFQDINITGNISLPVTGTRLGDIGGCNGITFSSPKTVYWNLAGENMWTATGWQLAGGAPSADNYPLAQDTAVFDETNPSATQININSYIDVGTINCAARTASALTFNFANTSSSRLDLLKDFMFSPKITLSGTVSSLSLNGKDYTTYLNSNGATIGTQITIGNTFGNTTVILSNDFVSTNSISLISGTLDTSSNNYSLSLTTLNSISTYTRYVKFNNSNVKFNSVNPGIYTLNTFQYYANLIVNSSNANIECTANGAINFSSGQGTFGNITFSSSAVTSISMMGNLTCNNLTFPSRTTSGVLPITVGNAITVNETLTLGTANTANARIQIQGARISGSAFAPGFQQTITINGSIYNLSDVDFRDIDISGNISLPITGTRLGDGGNCNNITFSTPKTVYWNLAGSNTVSANGWQLAAGSPDPNNFPLAQDTAIIDETNPSASQIYINAGYYLPTLDFSNRTTSNITLLPSSATTIAGNLILSNKVTINSSNVMTFIGYGSKTITSNGAIIDCPVTFYRRNSSFTFADNCTIGSSRQLTLTSSTINLLANQSLTVGRLNSSYYINFGNSSVIYINGSGATILAGFWYSTGVANIVCTYSGSVGTRTISPAYGSGGANVWVSGGSDTVTCTGALGKLDMTGFSGTVSLGLSQALTFYDDVIIPASVKISNVMTQSSALTFAKPDGAQLINFGNTTTVTYNLINISAGSNAVVQFAGNLSSTLGNGNLNLVSGTLDIGNVNVTVNTFSSKGTRNRALTFNGGSLTAIAPGFSTFNAEGSNLTTSGSGTINLPSPYTKTFSGNGFTYPTLVQSGAGNLVITGSNTFTNIYNTVTPTKVTFPAGNTTTFTDSFNLSGIPGQLVTITSSSSSAATISLSKGLAISNYLDLSYSTATPNNVWYAGGNSVDSGNNIGWTFISPIQIGGGVSIGPGISFT